ncbi:hypothetical protein [Niastella populi]|uniref:Uncharacterized protein n=1 Tax=Niastella populi TaxID=550983 RepID=A0A1V9FEG1_9BACT|nr:hypothetical protein [Niastella populi]OQP56749.1 hypothetical protein A4R26_25185 [Niastella populi]
MDTFNVCKLQRWINKNRVDHLILNDKMAKSDQEAEKHFLLYSFTAALVKYQSLLNEENKGR